MKKVLAILLLVVTSFSVLAQSSNNNPKYFNVLNFGAKGNGKVVYDCITTSSSTTIQSATAAFTSTAVDAGKIVHIDSAGVSYARFTDTILSVTDATHAVLKHAATYSTSNQMMDYGTDDVPGIQAALNAAKAAGGGTVYFPNPNIWGGMFYDIAGPMITSIDGGANPNSQIVIPLDSGVHVNNPPTITIKMQGEIEPMFVDAGQDQFNDYQEFHGAVLYSTVTLGNGSVIGSSYFNDGYGNVNFTWAIFDKLCIRSYNGWKNHPVGTNRNGIDRTYLIKCIVTNLMIDCSCPPNFSVIPTYGTGLIGAEVYNFAQQMGDNVFISGYYNAITLGEHESWGTLIINTSYYGVQPVYGGGGIVIKSLIVEATKYMVYIGNGSPENNIQIIHYEPEHDTSPSWVSFAYDVYVDAATNRCVILDYVQCASGAEGFVCNDYSKLGVKYFGYGSSAVSEIDRHMQTVTDSSTVTVNLLEGRQIYWTLGGNHSLAFSRIAAGDHFNLIVKENSTGGYAVVFPGGSQVTGTLVTAANAINTITGIYDGTKYYFYIWSNSSSSTQQTLSDSTNIQWSIGGGNAALVHMTKTASNTSRNITITGVNAPQYVTLKVFHDSVGTTINLPDLKSFNFQWGANKNDITFLHGYNDGTGWLWESSVFNAPVLYDTSAQAYFNKVLLAGGSITDPQKVALDTFYLHLKGQGYYSAIKAMWFPVWGAPNPDAYNMINGTPFDLSFSGSWAYASSGITPDGTTAYASTNFNPSVNATQNSLGIGEYYQNYGGGAHGNQMGCWNGSNGCLLQISSTSIGGGINSSTYGPYTTTPSRLGYIIRNNSSNVVVYRDGTSIGTLTSTSTTPNNVNLILGGLMGSGTPAYYGDAKISFAIITDGTLTSGQIADLSAAVQTLHTSFGIQQ